MLVQYSASGPLPATVADDLERGRIVKFVPSPVPLPDASDAAFLLQDLPERLKLKNISYHPETDSVRGFRGTPDERSRITAILKRHNADVQHFLERAIPALTPGWVVATCSIRPLEEQGRHLSAHASNELVHFDAGAYGATHGDRILRFFVNLNPTRPRVWISKGDFTSVFARWGARAGLARSDLAPAPLDRLRTAITRAVGGFVPAARLLDGSPYDSTMRRFHNFLKDTPAFQESPEGHEQLEFEPSSAWMVFTDSVSHACISGQIAFVSTFIIPLQNCRLPEFTPYHILERGVPTGPTAP